jgi:hypothetical protein
MTTATKEIVATIFSILYISSDSIDDRWRIPVPPKSGRNRKIVMNPIIRRYCMGKGSLLKKYKVDAAGTIRIAMIERKNRLLAAIASPPLILVVNCMARIPPGAAERSKIANEVSGDKLKIFTRTIPRKGTSTIFASRTFVIKW